jgi:ABC-type Na+ efflux pump permease subunit
VFLLTTAWKDLLRRLRDPLSFALWLGIPLAIGGMLRLVFGGDGGPSPRATVLVADEDGSVLSHLLLGALEQGGTQGLPFEAEPVELDEGRARLADGKASALLVIPAGFGAAVLEEEPCALELVKNPAQRILPGMVEESLGLFVDAVFYAHRILGEPLRAMAAEPPPERVTLADEDVARIALAFNGAVERCAALLSPPAIKLVVEEAGAEDEEDGPGFAELFFPSMLFMTLFFLAQGMSEDLWVERSAGTLRRALVAPQRASTFLGGKLLAAVALIACVSLAGLVLGRLVFGLSLAHLPLAVLWCGLSGALLVLFLYVLQLFASSQRGGNLLSTLVTLPLLMLGGSFFPFEAMPPGMAALGRRTPNGFALEELKAIVSGSFEPGSLALAALLLLAACALLFLLATRRLSGAFARS